MRTIQAEDEIAAANMALGAAFSGRLGVTATSGPGMDLKAETIGLAVAMELPLVIVDVQRAGPSTGMPTKTEAADLLMALYGRHGESPLPVVAASTPADCFDTAIEAVRIAVTHRTPVILLTDTFLANSSEPWRLPDVALAAGDRPPVRHRARPDFLPYARDENLARPWAVPGTPGLRHRIGGLEKEDVTGNISYDSENHEHMTRLRAERVARVRGAGPRGGRPGRRRLPAGAGLGLELRRHPGRGAQAAARAGPEAGHRPPAPPEPAAGQHRARCCAPTSGCSCPEMNMGQLSRLLRAEFLIDVESYTKVDGLPIFTRDVMEQVHGAAG